MPSNHQLCFQLDRIEKKCDLILEYLHKQFGDTPDSFRMAMSPIGGTMDFQIKDDGKGIVFTATPQKNGQPVTLQPGQVPTWTVSDPAALTISVDSTGLICTGTIPSPAKDEAGLTVTISLTLADNTVVTDTSAPFDIVADPDNIDSFVIQEAAQ
jgi:hypothetical protein